MRKDRQSRAGFTIPEILVSVMLLVIAVTGSIGGWLFIIRGERYNSAQNELDIDVRKAMERIRAELRASSMDKVFFYPAGVGPFTAISFPLARDSNGDGAIELDANTNIIWDTTQIYHVWQSTPNQLRLTIFDPRDNSLTTAQRQQQINDVVAAGNGAGTLNGQNATTRAIFENLFTWSIYGKSALIDAYSAQLGRMLNAVFGSISLSPGSHSYKFSVVGKNASSTGYKIGLDSLVVSPSAYPREAEAQLPVAAQSGATAAREYMAGGSWSGNHQLSFPASAVGHYVTLSMENDRWEETNFQETGALCEESFVEFDTSLSPPDFVVRMSEQTTAWSAGAQTRDPYSHSSSGDTLRGAAVRVLVRGAGMPDGGAIEHAGPLHCIWMYSAASRPLKIKAAYFAEAADQDSYSPDAVDAGIQLEFQGSGTSVTIGANDYAQALLPSGVGVQIDKLKSYVVSFLVDDVSGQSDAKYWVETGTYTNPVPPGSYLIPDSSSPDEAATRAANWSGRGDVIQDTRLFSVEHIHTLAPSNGMFTSHIFDTHLSAPVYSDISWHAVKPWGTQLKMRVRTADNADMSDAAAWSNVTAMTSGGAISPGNRRYCQFRAEMQSGFSGWYVPSLQDVTIRWNGETRVTDLGGTVTTGPDYGIFELKVDDKPLVKGVGLDLTIYKDVRKLGGGLSRLTSAAAVEVEPRNTGK